jgi:poly-gamma-glutamate synthesis protein (capsule biosynthesis protein)
MRLAHQLALVAFAFLASACGCSEEGEPTPSQPTPPSEPDAGLEAAAPTDAALAPDAANAAPKTAKPSDKLVILAGGDVNLARGCGQHILKDASYDPFRVVRPLLASADLRFVNLECQLSDQGGVTQSKVNRLVFTGPPGGAQTLANAGIDVVSLANNHMWDYGKKALLETFDNLERAGVRYVGASRERDQVYEPLIVNKNGWSIAIFAVTHIWNQGAFDRHPGRDHVAWAAFDELGKKLKKARKKHDLVLVSYHGGGEYVDMPMQWTREFVRAVMATGADAVIGHHPHVPHGVGWHGDRPVFYSLGNLVFAMHSDHPWTGTSFFARLTFSRNDKPLVEACPYHILGHVPMLFDGKTKAARERTFTQHLKLVSVTVGGTRIGEPGEHSCVVLEPPEQKRARRRR